MSDAERKSPKPENSFDIEGLIKRIQKIKEDLEKKLATASEDELNRTLEAVGVLLRTTDRYPEDEDIDTAKEELENVKNRVEARLAEIRGEEASNVPEENDVSTDEAEKPSKVDDVGSQTEQTKIFQEILPLIRYSESIKNFIKDDIDNAPEDELEVAITSCNVLLSHIGSDGSGGDELSGAFKMIKHLNNSSTDQREKLTHPVTAAKLTELRREIEGYKRQIGAKLAEIRGKEVGEENNQNAETPESTPEEQIEEQIDKLIQLTNDKLLEPDYDPRFDVVDYGLQLPEYASLLLEHSKELGASRLEFRIKIRDLESLITRILDRINEINESDFSRWKKEVEVVFSDPATDQGKYWQLVNQDVPDLAMIGSETEIQEANQELNNLLLVAKSHYQDLDDDSNSFMESTYWSKGAARSKELENLQVRYRDYVEEQKEILSRPERLKTEILEMLDAMDADSWSGVLLDSKIEHINDVLLAQLDELNDPEHNKYEKEVGRRINLYLSYLHFQPIFDGPRDPKNVNYGEKSIYFNPDNIHDLINGGIEGKTNFSYAPRKAVFNWDPNKNEPGLQGVEYVPTATAEIMRMIDTIYKGSLGYSDGYGNFRNGNITIDFYDRDGQVITARMNEDNLEFRKAGEGAGRLAVDGQGRKIKAESIAIQKNDLINFITERTGHERSLVRNVFRAHQMFTLHQSFWMAGTPEISDKFFQTFDWYSYFLKYAGRNTDSYLRDFTLIVFGLLPKSDDLNIISPIKYNIIMDHLKSQVIDQEKLTKVGLSGKVKAQLSDGGQAASLWQNSPRRWKRKGFGNYRWFLEGPIIPLSSRKGQDKKGMGYTFMPPLAYFTVPPRSGMKTHFKVDNGRKVEFMDFVDDRGQFIYEKMPFEFLSEGQFREFYKNLQDGPRRFHEQMLTGKPDEIASKAMSRDVLKDWRNILVYAVPMLRIVGHMDDKQSLMDEKGNPVILDGELVKFNLYDSVIRRISIALMIAIIIDRTVRQADEDRWNDMKVRHLLKSGIEAGFIDEEDAEFIKIVAMNEGELFIMGLVDSVIEQIKLSA